RYRATDQKTSGIDARDKFSPFGEFGERLGDDGDPPRIREHRGQILELNARLGEIGDLPHQLFDDAGDLGEPTHASSTHLSMFHPAPQRVGLLLTAYIFFVVINERCCRYNGSVGTSAQRMGPASPSWRATSLGSAVTASASMMPSM